MLARGGRDMVLDQKPDKKLAPVSFSVAGTNDICGPPIPTTLRHFTGSPLAEHPRKDDLASHFLLQTNQPGIMASVFRWGIISTGSIASKFASVGAD